MSRSKPRLPALASLLVLIAAPLVGQEAAYESPDTEAMIKDALSAATHEMAMGATVVDWEQNVLKEGDNGWTCFPTPPPFEKAPMCFDEPWLSWAASWMGKQPVDIDRIGVGYMLAGDSGASNSDPYAEGETDDWVVAGPHLMVISPGNTGLAGITTDPSTGGPWVMWEGTPYAHIMVPVGGEHECMHCKMHEEHEKKHEGHEGECQ
jgi:hypothetical protein